MASWRSCFRLAHFLVDLMATKSASGVTPPANAPVNGKTLPSRHGHAEPRLPHERDESSDSHPGTADVRIERAASDLEKGRQDTGRTPVVTELARQAFPSPPPTKNGPSGIRGTDAKG